MIHRPADEVWALVGDAARLHEWFPGIVSCRVEGSTRTITLGTGIELPEQITVYDPVQRRFQYRITSPLMTDHRGSIDVIELDARSCVVVYTTDCDPRTMALTIGGGTAGALDELERRFPPPEPAAPANGNRPASGNRPGNGNGQGGLGNLTHTEPEGTGD